MKCNLANNNCHRSNLVVQPRRGSLLMWYNHNVDGEGGMGELDWMSYHGGCDVLGRGEKWIANMWINVVGGGRGWLDGGTGPDLSKSRREEL